MLAALKVLVLIYFWFVLPVLMGNLWAVFRGKEKRSALYLYLTGTAAIWAVFFMISKCVLGGEASLNTLKLYWMILIAAATLLGILYAVRRPMLTLETAMQGIVPKVILLVACTLLTVGCIVLSGGTKEDHTAETVMTMYMTDSLYEYSAMTGSAKEELTGLEAELLKRQEEAPIEALYAVYVSFSNIHPAKFVKRLLPFFLLPFYFFTYTGWADYLFRNNVKKQIWFLITVWGLYGITLIADKSLLLQVYRNCWNGETLFFLGMLPFAVLLLMEKDRLTGFIVKYMLCALAGQLLYRKGFFFVSFIFVMILADALIKRWKNGRSFTANKI